MIGKVCHSILGISKSNFPTTRLELENIIFVKHNYSMCFHHGPQSHFQNNFFNFMNWNLNSLTKDNFHRVDLIWAHNSIFIYDLISVCETNLNDSVSLPETLLNDYIFESTNHPSNVKHGGVGLFL